MKKCTVLFLVLALVFTMSAALAEPVTIHFAAQGDSILATQAVADAFNAKADFGQPFLYGA